MASERATARPGAPLSERGPRAKLGEPLSRSQRALLTALVSGATLTECARSMSKSTSTLGTHLGRAKARLGARTTEQACVLFDRAERAVASLETAVAVPDGIL